MVVSIGFSLQLVFNKYVFIFVLNGLLVILQVLVNFIFFMGEIIKVYQKLLVLGIIVQLVILIRVLRIIIVEVIYIIILLKLFLFVGFFISSFRLQFMGQRSQELGQQVDCVLLCIRKEGDWVFRVIVFFKCLYVVFIFYFLSWVRGDYFEIRVRVMWLNFRFKGYI